MIYGERVRLRHAELADLETFVRWLNDPEVRIGINRYLPISMAEEEKWFEAMMEKDERVRPFAIEARQGEAWALVGSCSLFDFDDIARNAELGIMIGERSQWGLGLGTDAMRALLDHGFDTLNLRRIYLRVLAFNERAIRLYEKLGFEHEGRLREHVFARGQYSDTLIMGMMRDNWRAGQGSET